MTQHHRQYTRHKAVLKVEVRTRKGWEPCTTVDVSRGGLFVKSDAHFDLQRVIQLRLHLPDGEPVSVLCQVRRNVIQVKGSSPVPGIGVEFFNMTKEVQARWDLFVLSLSESDKAAMAAALNPRPPGGTGGGAGAGTPGSGGAGGARLDSAGVGSPGGWGAAKNRRASTQATIDAMSQRTPRGGHVAPGPRIRGRPRGKPVKSAAPYEPREDLPAVIIRIRPSSAGRLQRIVEQRLWGEPLTLRTGERLEQGQRTELVLVHHKTDAEFVVHAACHACSPVDRQGQQQVTLTFPPLTDELKGGLNRFFRTGTRDHQHMGQQERDLLDRRRARATHNPRDPQALVEFGWAVLAVEEKPEEAAEIFLKALALADRREDIHHALGICYSLTQRTELAYQFIRSSLRLQGGEVQQAANATAETKKRSLYQDEVGVRRGDSSTGRRGAGGRGGRW